MKDGWQPTLRVLHLDDCAAGTTFVGNVCWRVGYGVAICGGPDNVVENNTFVDCKLAVDVEDRGLRWWTFKRLPNGEVTAIDNRSGKESCLLLDRLKQVPYNRPPYTKYPHLADILDREPIAAPWYCRICRNVSVGGQFLRLKGKVQEQWVTIEDNWTQRDPGFVDLESGDLRLQEDSPVFELGFEPIPFEKIGLYEDDTRASWPVKPEPVDPNWLPYWMKEQ